MWRELSSLNVTMGNQMYNGLPFGDELKKLISRIGYSKPIENRKIMVSNIDQRGI